MYDLTYVKKRRRKKIAALVSLFTAVGITSLVIISFLGRTVGTFSVSLKNSDVKLSLYKTLDFEASKPTSYLFVDEVPGFRETSFVNLPDAEILDNEETPYNYGEWKDETGRVDSVEYLKYTFYVTNSGLSIAQYNFNIKITDRSKETDGSRILDDTLRVMVFENNPADNSHDYRVFAKQAAEKNYDKDGNETMCEFVSTVPVLKPYDDYPREDDEHPLAETFVSSSVVAQYKVSNFAHGDVKRYTIVMWLEGEDPQSDNDKGAPAGATIKLGVDISAYANS